MKKLNGRYIWMLALIVMSVSSLFAQDAREEIEVSIVEVPVNVVDNSNKAVRGLDRSQFSVTIDGEPAEIRYFDVIDLQTIPTDREEFVEIHPAARRKFLFLFDLSASSPDSLLRASDAAIGFVNDTMRPQDLAAVATFSVQSGTRLLTGFTRSKRALELAIGTLGNPEFYRVQDPLMLTASVTGSGSTGGEITAEPTVDTGGGAGSGLRSIASQVAENAAADYARMNRRVSDEHRKNQLRKQFQNLSSVGRLLDGVRGQKQVLFFSQGFDPTLITGSGMGSQSASNAAARGEIWNLDSDEIYGSSGVAEELEQMAELFRRSDVVLHAIDIAGLRTKGGRANFTSSTDESLYLLANPTGGTVFKNTNHLEETLEKAAGLHEVVYVLGVTAPSGGEVGEFREISVELDERGARVIHRPGYYVKTGQQNPLEMFTSMTELLTGAGGYNAYDVDITAIPLPGGAGSTVETVVEIDGDDLLRQSNGTAVQADVFTYAFTPNGDVAGYFHEDVGFDASQAVEGFGDRGVRILGNLDLAPGEYDIRTLVRSKVTGEAGASSVSVRVPEKAEMSDLLFFEDQENWVMLRNRTAEGKTYPFVLGENVFVPSSHADPSGDDPLQFAVFTWGLDPDQLALQPIVMDSSGGRQEVPIQLIGRTAPDEAGMMKLLFQLDHSNLSPGDYSIRLGIRGADGQPVWGSGSLRVE